ncbi:MAG TPA: DUF3489 domain-containing protein [Brevibacterium sp.]|nr:DUF3489 domain-containing protein [Brevibacterium sp.]
MTKLSDTQLVILSTASQRDDRNVLPLPGSLRGGAAKKVIGALLSRGLIAERPGQDRHEPDAARNTVWRNEADGRAVRLFITRVGLDAVGVETEDGATLRDTAPDGATDAPSQDTAPDTPADAAPAPRARKPREGTKQARLIEMLRAPEGATIDEIVAATGWRPHTVRGAMSGALKKKLGLTITSEKIEDRGRCYRIVDG